MPEPKWKVIVVTRTAFTLHIETTNDNNKGKHEWTFDNLEDLTEFYRTNTYLEEVISAVEDA